MRLQLRRLRLAASTSAAPVGPPDARDDDDVVDAERDLVGDAAVAGVGG